MHQFPLHDLQTFHGIHSIQGRQKIPGLYDLAHVAGWEPHNLYDDLGHVS